MVLKKTESFWGVTVLLLAAGFIAVGCDTGTIEPEETITGINFTAAHLEKDAAIHGAVAGVFSGPEGVWTLVSGTGDTDNALFTIDGTSLKINSGALAAATGVYSVRVQVKAIATGKTFARFCTVAVTTPPVSAAIINNQTGFYGFLNDNCADSTAEAPVVLKLEDNAKTALSNLREYVWRAGLAAGRQYFVIWDMREMTGLTAESIGQWFKPFGSVDSAAIRVLMKGVLLPEDITSI